MLAGTQSDKASKRPSNYQNYQNISYTETRSQIPTPLHPFIHSSFLFPYPFPLKVPSPHIPLRVSLTSNSNSISKSNNSFNPLRNSSPSSSLSGNKGLRGYGLYPCIVLSTYSICEMNVSVSHLQDFYRIQKGRRKQKGEKKDRKGMGKRNKGVKNILIPLIPAGTALSSALARTACNISASRISSFVGGESSLLLRKFQSFIVANGAKFGIPLTVP